MWQVKVFKTAQQLERWLSRMDGRIQWTEIFVNNAYGVEYRKLRRVY